MKDVKQLVEAVYKEKSNAYSSNELSTSKSYKLLKKRSESDQKEAALIVLSKVKENQSNIRPLSVKGLLSICEGLLRKKLNYNEEEWMTLIDNFKQNVCVDTNDYRAYLPFNAFPITYAVKQMEYYVKNNKPSEKLIKYINELLEWEHFHPKEATYSGADMAKVTEKLHSIISEHSNEVPKFNLKTEDIGPKVMEVVNVISENQSTFYSIFNLAYAAKGSKPSEAFTKELEGYLSNTNKETYRTVGQQILEIAAVQPFIEKTTKGLYNDITQLHYLCEPSRQFIKGMVWTMQPFSDKNTIQIISKLTEKAFSIIPGKTTAAAGIGNACIFILGNMRGKDGLGALSRLKLKIKNNGVKKAIDKNLLEGAKKYNVSVEELKEMAVPDFGLTNGQKTIPFDDYSLQISIDNSKVIQQWLKPDGLAMKSVPSVVKNSEKLTAKLKDLRKEVKEIQKVYTAQKQRIDNQFILDRSIDYASFQKHYLLHGLVNPIVKKLIWKLTKNNNSIDAVFVNENWCTINNELIDWVDENTTIKLWHPIHATEEDIVLWRDKIIALEWKQPLKQAFREIYVLTDAEINTQSYSNRMAAHIVKQHQFKTLATLRDWKYSLLGAYDDGRDNEVCEKHLPEHKINAQYWIDDLLLEYSDDSCNEAGIWNYVGTDQVKFTNEAGETLDLIDVPKIVFTEIMRDVDLFVGVASVGNDPQWADNNSERQANRDYWQSYAFGDLSEIAKTRKSILERLLPRLTKLKGKAHLEGKFLTVQGTLRTYKIHIGSGNILMAPNDQYLCIVPSRSVDKTTEKLFIPFEGDKGLSIVLSKAFLLAEDTKITDETILSQINRK